MYSCFTPGKPWLDTDGNPIQAHGGYMYYENSTYYWIGENKEFTDGVNGIWQAVHTLTITVNIKSMQICRIG